MSNWFKVSGQGCPVALGGVQCDTNLDCAHAAQQHRCSSLSTSSTGLGWTDSGAIRSSSAGNLTCHPIRKVCEMYKNGKDAGQAFDIKYFTTIYSIILVITFLISLIVMKFDFLLGMSIFSIPILIMGFYVLWIQKCCRIKNVSILILWDILLHWIPALMLLGFLIFKNPKIKTKRTFWAGYGMAAISGLVYTIIKYNSLENIYNTPRLSLLGGFISILLITTLLVYKRVT